ncbi:MAG: tetratricopeptide repeat protein [Anaerolineales bacterium]
MQLKGRRFEPTTEPPRLTAGRTAVYTAAILICLGIFKLLDNGTIRSPFAPPPTPTRMAMSYAEEGKAFFDAGILEKAITAYQKAVGVDSNDLQNPEWCTFGRSTEAPTPQVPTETPSSLFSTGTPSSPASSIATPSLTLTVTPSPQVWSGTPDPQLQSEPSDPQLWAELARILAYSSELQLSADEKRIRLEQAVCSVTIALNINPDYAFGHAIKVLVLDWYANSEWMDAETREETLNKAYQASAQALALDSGSALALAFKAEVLIDQGNWSAALDVGAQAAQLGPEIMDVHRAYAYVLESNGYYTRAIEEYQAAILLNPNLPFLYIRLGANYRKLGETATDTATRDLNIDKALEAFARAADLNPNDPIPYLSIAQTESNQGNFFDAELYARKALSLDNTDAYLYGRLGVIYYKAKNYETAIKVLRCAIRGCTAADNEAQGVDVIEILPLKANSVDVYYTYGSVMAFYGKDTPANCVEAASIFAELRASPYFDETVDTIIREGEVLCAAYTRAPTP